MKKEIKKLFYIGFIQGVYLGYLIIREKQPRAKIIRVKYLFV